MPSHDRLPFPTPLHVITGVCAPERRRYAHTISRLGAPVVRELSTDVDVFHTVGVDLDSAVVITVVDARHLLDDLTDASPLIEEAALGDDRGDVGARARQAATLIELAHLVAVVGWTGLDTDRLSLLMALLSHLAPTALIRLSTSPEGDLLPLQQHRARTAPWSERPGWVRALNDEHDAYMTDPRITTFRYEQLRPFHPGRLVPALDRIDAGDHGRLLRSAGFCRLATRPRTLARWEQVGGAMWIDPLPSDGLDPAGQDLCLTGLDLDIAGLRRAFDAAALTDDELEAGPDAWRRFADPLPRWSSGGSAIRG